MKQKASLTLMQYLEVDELTIVLRRSLEQLYPWEKNFYFVLSCLVFYLILYEKFISDFERRWIGFLQFQINLNHSPAHKAKHGPSAQLMV
jgi:hypothetical protein